MNDKTESVDTHSRPSSERDGACICDYNPSTTDGPQEDCPFHGRPYAYWIERGDALAQRLAAVEALVAAAEQREATSLSRTFDGGSFGAWVDAHELRAVLSNPPGVTP